MYHDASERHTPAKNTGAGKLLSGCGCRLLPKPQQPGAHAKDGDVEAQEVRQPLPVQVDLAPVFVDGVGVEPPQGLVVAVW
jgi:hypothetical protein